MQQLYTILFLPPNCSEYHFFDRVFYVDSSVPLLRVAELNRKSPMFPVYKVVQVNFIDL